MNGTAEYFLGGLFAPELYERIEQITWYESGSPKGWRHHCPVCGPSREVASWDDVLDIQQQHRHHGVRPPGGHPKLRTSRWAQRRTPGRVPAKVRR